MAVFPDWKNTHFELLYLNKGTGVSVVSLHPGVVATSIMRKRDGNNGLMARIMNLGNPIIKYLAATSTDGAKTTIHCAVSPDIPSQSGLYFS